MQNKNVKMLGKTEHLKRELIKMDVNKSENQISQGDYEKSIVVNKINELYEKLVSKAS